MKITQKLIKQVIAHNKIQHRDLAWYDFQRLPEVLAINYALHFCKTDSLYEIKIEALTYSSVTTEPKVGRPQLMKDGKRVNVYLDAASLHAASKLSSGNVSEGIRIALQRSIK